MDSISKAALAAYTEAFGSTITALSKEGIFITPTVTRKNRLNFTVTYLNYGDAYLTYNVQTGFFDVHIGKAGGFDTVKAKEYADRILFTTYFASDLNAELEQVRENFDTSTGCQE